MDNLNITDFTQENINAWHEAYKLVEEARRIELKNIEVPVKLEDSTIEIMIKHEKQLAWRMVRHANSKITFTGNQIYSQSETQIADYFEGE